MPRNRRDNSEQNNLKPSDLEEDFLDVDKPLPGQNFYCISFVSPEKVLKQKELFMFYHYEQAFYKKIRDLVDTALTTTIDSCYDGKVDISDIVKLKKSVLGACKEEQQEWNGFKDSFENFLYRDEEKIGEEFDKQNNFKTSVRGVKVRGVFDSKREADVRAAVLQRQDPLFDVFVGQIGYWCPWDPNPTKIDDIEYLNSDLNKLVKEYKSNEAKKDAFYQEQKTSRQKDALSAEERLKHHQGLNETLEQQKEMQNALSNVETASGATIQHQPIELLPPIINYNDIPELNSMLTITESGNDTPTAITTSLVINDNNAKEITLEQESEQLQGNDIWLQRKQQSSE